MKAAVVSAAAIAVMVPGNALAATAEQKCQDGVAVAGTKYFGSVIKHVTRCEQLIADATLPDTTNCRPLAGPVDDSSTEKKVDKAREKLSKLVGKKCGAVNLADVGIGSPCDAATTATELSDCLAEEAHGRSAENLVETLFDTTGAIDAEEFDDTRACQQTLAKEAGKYAKARLKERRGCAKKFVAGKVDGTCPNAKNVAKLDKARAKFEDKVAAACGEDQVSGPNALTPGFPCDAFGITGFVRTGLFDNVISVAELFTRCMVNVVAGAGDMGADTAYPLEDDEPFFLGVAAGDATEDSFVVWTRTSGAGDVTAEVATDAEFESIVDTQVVSPDAAADNTVKADVQGLTAATQYYYRFSQGGETSRVGRVRTAPAAGSTEPITFAFTGDANAAFKPYSVLEQVTLADPDVWLFIGDTIYSDDVRTGTCRSTVRSDYHDRYEENRDDRALRDLMASVGTYTIWDDHEVTNDFYGTDPSLQAQIADGNQAFRDYMPIRDLMDPQQLYRSFRWGDVAEFFLIDPRAYRDPQAHLTEPRCITGTCSVSGDDCVEQADCDAVQPGQVCAKGVCSVTGDPCGVQADCDAVQLGQECHFGVCDLSGDTCNLDTECLPACPALPAFEVHEFVSCDLIGLETLPTPDCETEIAAPGRAYLGATQMQWLKDGLVNSPATFKFVMNGPIISSLLFVPYDRWEGYTAERTELLDFIANEGVNNVFVLSTDIHMAAVNDEVEPGSGVGELIAGAVGMDPIFRELPASLVPIVGNLPVLFQTVSYYDIDRFTVATATVSTTGLTMRWLDNAGQVLHETTIPAIP